MIEAATEDLETPPEVMQFQAWLTDVNHVLEAATLRLQTFTETLPEVPAHPVSVQIHKKSTPSASSKTDAPLSTTDEELTKQGAITFFHDGLKQLAASSSQIKEWQEKLLAGEEIDVWEMLTGMQSYIFSMIRSWPICRTVHGEDLSAMKDLLNTLLMELHGYWSRYDPHRKGASIKSFLTTYTQTVMGRITQGRNQFHRRVTKAEVTTDADYAMEYHPKETRAAFVATLEGETVSITLRLKRGFSGKTEVVTREYEYESVQTAIRKYYARHNVASLDDPLERNDGKDTKATRANLVSASAEMVSGQTIHALHKESFIERFWEIVNEFFEEVAADPEREKGERDADVLRTFLFKTDDKGKRLTLVAIGEIFNISRERVRQIKNKLYLEFESRLKGSFSKREKALLQLYLFGTPDDFGMEKAIDLQHLTSN